MNSAETNIVTLADPPGPSVDLFSRWTRTGDGTSWEVTRLFDADGEIYVELVSGDMRWTSEHERERSLVPALTLLREFRRDDHAYLR